MPYTHQGFKDPKDARRRHDENDSVELDGRLLEMIGDGKGETYKECCSTHRSYGSSKSRPCQ